MAEGESKSPRQVKIKTPDINNKEKKRHDDSDTDVDTEGGTNSRPQSVKIDLTRVRSAYSAKTHKESNLPPVLTEYGMEEEKHKEKNKRRKKKVKSDREYEDNDGNNEKRKKKREEALSRTTSERYQQIMENQEDGGNFYSRKVSGIVSRVKTQSDSRSQTPRTPRTPRQEEEDSNKKQQKSKQKKKLQRHDLTTNNEFLKSIPKTEMAKIIELQDKLMKEGKLKTQAEVDRFWQDVKKPDAYMSYVKPQQPNQPSGSTSGSTLSRNNMETHSTITALQDIPGRSLSQISERSSVPPQFKDTQDWAITQQFKYQHSKANTPAQKTKPATDLEKKFPKTQMPQLHCFTMDLGEKPPDPEQLAREAELKVRIKQRKRFLRKLNRMHQMAMANNAATNRIIEKHGELSQIFDGNTLRDLLSILPAPEDEFISEDEVRVPESIYPALPPPSRGNTSKSRSLVSRESRASLGSRGSFRKESSRQKLGSRGKSRSIEALPPPPPQIPHSQVPLTLDEIRHKSRTLDAKCLSTNWINYMRSGRAVPSES